MENSNKLSEILGRALKGQEMLSKNLDALEANFNTFHDDVFGKDGISTQIENRLTSLETKIRIVTYIVASVVSILIGTIVDKIMH